MISAHQEEINFTWDEGDIDDDDDDNDDNVDPREEPNLVSLMMREGVRRRGVSRAGSAPPPSPPSRFEP